MRGEENPLRLARASAAVVLLVDGLGAAQLGQRAGHARTLATAPGGSLDAGFPSTTAVALASLTTGELAGAHGIVGYDAFVPGAGVRNQLRDWGGPMDPATWQRSPTLLEQQPSIVIGEPRHAASGFTHAVLRGAEYRGGRTMADRFALVRAAARERSLVYAYVPELDRTGHESGWQSPEWTDALEELDGHVRELAASLLRDAGLVVTADHGMVDVDASAHLIVPPGLLERVAHVAGEPRCLQLQVEGDADAVARSWAAWLGDAAWVATRDEVVAAGWFGEVHPEVAPRLGDVFVAARGRRAIYVDEADPGRGMIGQHGSLTPDELRVPLRRFGAFA
ncbi:alkaline phosphatase family protein [Agrococcus sp. HG114]|uniref:alkaline phosphatase family protein n=1 Tax=Agrococcus sp. HG114 TaxID=2969757 RepID=UPI00215AC437|nr:alkaline phosphatase family protein [Agrococcus sp. HG114]MCR8669947.1 alkaline phosphatase family protein [Agrococcus sp. HG114]